MVAAAEAFADSRTERRSFDVVFEMHGSGLDLLSNALFGAGLSPETDEQVKHATPDVMAGVVAQALYPAGWMERLPIPVNRRFDSALPRMAGAVDEIIANHRARGRTAHDGLTMLTEAEVLGDGPVTVDKLAQLPLTKASIPSVDRVTVCPRESSCNCRFPAGSAWTSRG